MATVLAASRQKCSFPARYILVSQPCIDRRGCGARLPQPSCDMDELDHMIKSRTFRWPGAAREIVAVYLNSSESIGNGPPAPIALKSLVTRIAAASGNPRGVCWRFIRQSGIKAKRSYRPWTKPEQQKLLDLISSHSLEEVTRMMRCLPTSVARCFIDWERTHGWVRTGLPNMV